MRILRASLLLILGVTIIAITLATHPVKTSQVQTFAAAKNTAVPAKTTPAPVKATTAPAKATAAPTKTTPAPAKTAAASTGTKSLEQIMKDKGITASKANIKIVVDKSDHTLSIISNGVFLKSYHVELGEGGSGDKQISGDHKTPEGTFYISEKSVLSPADEYLGTRWMELSYPNIEDADRGLAQGLISRNTHDRILDAIEDGAIPPQTTALGGGVGIHGGSTKAFGSDWTFGCVGLTNGSVEDFYNYVKVGTQVIIQK